MSIKFKIEKETRFDLSELKTYDKYWIWAGLECIASADNEEDAREKYEQVKANYKFAKREIIAEEEI
jgi:hypothetical protein